MIISGFGLRESQKTRPNRSEGRNKAGAEFWIGTILGGFLLFAVSFCLLDDSVMSIMASIVFCWFFGLFAQVAVDLTSAIRTRQYGRTDWMVISGCIAYSLTVIAFSWYYGWRLENTSLIAMIGFAPMLTYWICKWGNLHDKSENLESAERPRSR
jgi:hypothetical protein